MASSMDLSEAQANSSQDLRLQPLLSRRGRDEPVPITREQRHIWLDMVRGNDSLAYHEPMIVRFSGPTDAETVKDALRLLVQRHEALRTSFADLDGDPVQIVHDDVELFLPDADLSDLPPDDREEALRALAAADAAVPFDLEQAPLMRARLVRLSDTDHRLALTFHHIMFDGRSLMYALTVELPAIHAALAVGEAPALPSMPQYGDYAVRQHAAGEPDWTGEIDYWRRMLTGGTQRVSLPVDRRRGGGARAAAMEMIPLDGELTRALEALARRHATSLYAVLLTALMTQLRRYGSEDDVTIGSVLDTRGSMALAGMVGYCLNTVALRAHPAPDRPFDEFLGEVSDVLFGAYEHGTLPFERVVRLFKGAVPGTEDGRFHVLFSMQPPPPRDAAVSIDLLTQPQAKADLYLEIEQTGEGLSARFTYDSDLFDPETVQRMAGHWRALLAAIVAAPGTPLGDLQMVPAQELAMLRALGLGRRRAIAASTLHALIERTIEDQPDAVAVVAGETRWTYAEFGRRADAVAERLIAAAVREGDLVAICVDRHPAMVGAILGILKAGAAYVPLDPSFPPPRLAAILADAKPAVLICDASTGSLFGGWQGIMLAIEDVAAAPSAALPATAGTPDSLAYIIYTSGSTGAPKGVEIAHRSVVNVVEAMRHRPGFAQGETVLAVSRLTFDMSVSDIFLPLVAGGTIAIAPSESITDPQLLAAEMERSGCTLVQATPAIWQNLITDGWTGKPGLKILSGGEALGRPLADDLLGRGMRLWNGYGPTEATIYTTMEEVARESTISIGTPIDNLEVRILDDRGHDLPCNVAGHLYIGGVGLARGYRDPALTARAFVVAGDGTRLHRSGDVALRRADGRIEWLGRSDGQIKIRGFRIDIGDIEAAICGCPGIAMAAVAAVDGTAGARSDLAAYVVPLSEGKPPDFSDLRRYLATKLPSYMVPTRYMVLDEMPLSASGKIQRKALPSSGFQFVTSTPSDLPQGDTERKIAAVWREVLELECVGATDDFFDLGGHSLLAAKLVGRLSAEFGRRLPLATLLRAPTIRQLAAILDGGPVPVDAPDTVVIGSSAGRPLFWVDATPNFRANGFRDFAAALGESIALVGLPVDTDGFARMEDRCAVEAIADRMAAAVVTFGRPGPHLVGGWCNGGLLALAVADRLRARGEAVDAVVMLDSTNQALYRNKMRRVGREIRQLFRTRREERIAYLGELVGGYASRMRRRLIPATDGASSLLDLTDRFIRIVRECDFPSYDGQVLLVEAESGLGADLSQWSGLLCGPIELIRVTGGHESVLHPPFVEALAGQLRSRFVRGETGEAAVAANVR